MYKNKYKIISILVLMVISFSFLLTGCSNSQTGSVTEESYAVSGTVKDKEGSGIEKVMIKFDDQGTAETNSDGQWQKVGLNGPVVINPAKEGYSFNPDNIEVSETKEDINITGDKTIDKKEYTLNIEVTGSGSYETNPSGSTFTAGEEVEITADPDNGSRFDHWDGDIKKSDNPTKVIMDDNKSITAVFVETDYSLETNTEGEGVINEREISANEIELTASPNKGWKFDHWEGDLSGNNNPETINVDSSKKVTAVFEKKEYSLSINTEGSGNVSKSPDSAVYKYGDEVQLNASADSDWYFDQWQGDLTGSNNPATIIIDSNQSITAVFAEQSSQENEFTLNVGEAGSVIVTEPSGKEVTVKENEKYNFSTQQPATLSLSASAQDNRYKFKGWSGDFSSSNSSVDIKVDSNKVVDANFKGNVFKLINSWGENWGENDDGSLFITYDAAKQANLQAWVIGKRSNYQAEAHALFEVDGSNRGQWKFNIKSGNSEKSFYPDRQILKGGSASFPSNRIALDITELLPFDGENIVLEVSNNSSSSGTVKSFAVEVNGQQFNSSTTNLNVSANSSKIITIENVSASTSAFAGQSADDLLESAAREIRSSDIDAYINSNKSVQSSNNTTDGHGTGWKNLTREEWQKAKEDGSIKILEAEDVLGQFQKVSDGRSIKKVDYSQSKYFPPVRSQGTEGSCAAWSVGYYIKSYYEAEDHGWDLSSGDNSKIMSPDFLYHLINGGVDGGSYFTDNLRVIDNIGISTWSEMPNNDSDHTSWPEESAFREAGDYRANIYNGSTGYYITINDDSDIEAIQSILANGYLVTVAVDSKKYSYLTENGVWTKDNYTNLNIDHANTLVGYYE